MTSHYTAISQEWNFWIYVGSIRPKTFAETSNGELQSQQEKLKVSVGGQRSVTRKTVSDEDGSLHEKASAENGKSLER